MNSTKKKDAYDISFREIIMCKYEDKQISFWMKLVFCIIWVAAIIAGLIYGAAFDYIIAILSIIAVLALNIYICNKYYKRWIDLVTFIILSVPVLYIFIHASIGYFSTMLVLIFACGVIYILGILNSLCINICYIINILVCFRFIDSKYVADLYGANVSLRFPYFFICIVLISYCLMYIIQRNWVEKKKRKQVLERRIYDEKRALEEMSMKVMDTMVHALGAKVAGEEEHCRRVANYAKEIAQRDGLDYLVCSNSYKAGLLHEIGMVGIPDVLIRNNNLKEQQYEVYKTYVDKGYKIISMLHTRNSESVAEAVLYHRENYDGSGFPKGLEGQNIPVMARIVAVSDYADRHMCRGEDVNMIINSLKELAGIRFDKKLAEIMIDILNEKN